MNNNRKNISDNDIVAWVAAIICLAAFWPLGIFMIIRLILKRPSSLAEKAKNEAEFAKSRAASAGTAGSGAAKSSTSKGSGKKNTKRSKKKKAPKASGADALLILAIVFFIIGASKIHNFYFVRGLVNLISGLFFAAGGGVSLFVRSYVLKRSRRLAKYITVMGLDDAKSVDEIAQATGGNKATIRKDLNYLAERGCFGPDAYFDVGLDSIVISPDAAELERQRRYSEETAAKQEAAVSADPSMAALEELRRFSEAITDARISDKAAQLESLTARIFKAVEDDPEKAPDIRKFTGYYVPATSKLLKSYCILEKQGVSGENITAAKRDIERVLDSLIDGYTRQLDRLFDSDAIDISSDIDVLETMLKQDGLSGDGDVFRSGSH